MTNSFTAHPGPWTAAHAVKKAAMRLACASRTSEEYSEVPGDRPGCGKFQRMQRNVCPGKYLCNAVASTLSLT